MLKHSKWKKGSGQKQKIAFRPVDCVFFLYKNLEAHSIANRLTLEIFKFKQTKKCHLKIKKKNEPCLNGCNRPNSKSSSFSSAKILFCLLIAFFVPNIILFFFFFFINFKERKKKNCLSIEYYLDFNIRMYVILLSLDIYLPLFNIFMN